MTPRSRTKDIPEIPSVLATTDFSELADRAIPQAYAVVDDGGTVNLMHVLELVEPQRTPNPLYAHYSPGEAPTADRLHRLQEQIAERLRALVPAGAEARRIRTFIHVVADSGVAASIVETASRLGVSLICLGSHGRSGIVKLLLGSVAQAVVEQSPCPVLVVRPGSPGERPPASRD